MQAHFELPFKCTSTQTKPTNIKGPFKLNSKVHKKIQTKNLKIFPLYDKDASGVDIN